MKETRKNMWIKATASIFGLITIVLAIAAAAIGIFMLMAWVLMTLWNALAGAFGWPTLTYQLALCAYALLSLIGGLFKARVSHTVKT